MMKRYPFLLVFLILFFAGCCCYRAPKIVAAPEGSSLKEARVFQKEKLAKGGNILVVPFSAGEGVEASDALDHVSLMIVKGIAETLGPAGKPFKILVEQDAQSADFVVKGRIMQMEEKSHFHKPWQKKTETFKLAIEGSVLGVEPEEILAKFSQTKKKESSENSFQPMGYDLGVEIGRFLLSSAQ